MESSFALLSLIVGYLCITNVESGPQKIPSFLKICHRNDPNLNECVKDSVESLRPYLVKGIPELGIPGCEPLEIPEVVINQGRGAVNVKSTYSDIRVYGPTRFELRNVKVNVDKNRVTMKIWLPHLYMASNYKMEGRILMLPITGSGFCEGNYTDIEATCIMESEIFKKNDGKEYLNVKKFLVNFDIGNAKVHLNDLFNGDQQLGDAMNLFINDNWKNVANEIRPVLEDTIGDLFREFSNKLYHRFSLDELLPP